MGLLHWHGVKGIVHQNISMFNKKKNNESQYSLNKHQHEYKIQKKVDEIFKTTVIPLFKIDLLGRWIH